MEQQRWIAVEAAPTNSEDFTSASKCARMETVPASCIMQKVILVSKMQNLLLYEKRQSEVWMERAKNLPKMIRRQIQTEGHCAG